MSEKDVAQFTRKTSALETQIFQLLGRGKIKNVTGTVRFFFEKMKTTHQVKTCVVIPKTYQTLVDNGTGLTHTHTHTHTRTPF